MWGLAASVLLKGLKCKPIRTGCPEQVPEPHSPSPKADTTTSILTSMWPNPPWMPLGKARVVSTERRVGLQPGSPQGLCRGLRLRQCLPMHWRRACQHVPVQDPVHVEHTAPSIQVRVSLPGCTQLVAIAAPLGWGFTLNIDLWQTQGCLKSTQIPPP